MYKYIIILMYALCIQCCRSQKVKYPIYFAEDICDQTLRIGSQPNNSSLLMKLFKNNSSKTIRSCKVVIESSNNEQIHTNVKHMIETYKSRELKSPNSITFTERDNNRRLIIDFNGLGDDIHLIVTSYRAIRDDQNCPKSYFLCEKNKCIHEVFRCDTYFNCDNDENELACALDLTPGNTILLTIILGILCSLFGTTCLLTTYVYYVYYKKRERLLDSKQIMYGTVNAGLPVSAQHSMKVYK